MAYFLLLAVVGGWAWASLRHRPLAPYVIIFFSVVVPAVAVEVTTLRVLHLYEWHMKLLADQEADVMLGSLLIAALNPLLAVLYARYCAARPVLKAFCAAVSLGLVEILLVNTGHMVYRMWSPLLTMGLFFAYFLGVWRLALHVGGIPIWLHVLGFTMWVNILVDIPLQGMAWLWHFRVHIFGEMVRDNRLTSFLHNAVLLGPMVTFISLSPERVKVRRAIAALGILLLIEAIEIRIGFLVHDRWSLAWSAAKYAGIIAAVATYKRWIRSRH